jgi:hypothetical protein
VELGGAIELHAAFREESRTSLPSLSAARRKSGEAIGLFVVFSQGKPHLESTTSRSTQHFKSLPLTNGPRCSAPNASLALCSTGSPITLTWAPGGPSRRRNRSSSISGSAMTMSNPANLSTRPPTRPVLKSFGDSRYRNGPRRSLATLAKSNFVSMMTLCILPH